MERLDSLRVGLVVVLLVVVLLAGQAIADSMVPSASGGDTSNAVGRAGFAYLTGVRTYAAAVLWNRLEPQFHEYYQELPLREQVSMLPTIKMVTILDPDFTEAYWVGAWVLASRGDVDEGLKLAREGVANNPDSAIMHINLAQILLFMDDDVEGAVREADRAIESSWLDQAEKHQGYAMARGIYAVAGEVEKEQAVLEVIEELDLLLGDGLGAGAHDHDGDGVPDH